MNVKSLSHVRLLATPWTAAYQAPPPMGFSRQEYWRGVPFPSPWVWANACKYRYCIWEVVQRNFPGGSDSVKFDCNVGNLGSIPRTGRCPEEGDATHSSILAWRIPWTEEPGGLYCPWGCNKSDTTEWLTLSFFQASLSRFPNMPRVAARRIKFWIQIIIFLIN